MIDKNEIDVTNWIPQKEKWDIFDTVENMKDAHAGYDGNNFKWFPKSYIRKYRTELAKLIKLNRNDYEIKIVYKKKNKENK